MFRVASLFIVPMLAGCLSESPPAAVDHVVLEPASFNSTPCGSIDCSDRDHIFVAAGDEILFLDSTPHGLLALVLDSQSVRVDLINTLTGSAWQWRIPASNWTELGQSTSIWMSGLSSLRALVGDSQFLMVFRQGDFQKQEHAVWKMGLVDHSSELIGMGNCSPRQFIGSDESFAYLVTDGTCTISNRSGNVVAIDEQGSTSMLDIDGDRLRHISPWSGGHLLVYNDWDTDWHETFLWDGDGLSHVAEINSSSRPIGLVPLSNSQLMVIDAGVGTDSAPRVFRLNMATGAFDLVAWGTIIASTDTSVVIASGGFWAHHHKDVWEYDSVTDATYELAAELPLILASDGRSLWTVHEHDDGTHIATWPIEQGIQVWPEPA